MKTKLSKALREVRKILGNTTFWLSGGQVLGIIREGDFLENEHDIDLGIKEEDLPILVEKLRKRFIVKLTAGTVRDGITLRPIDHTDIVRVVKFEINGVGIDIFVYLLRNGRRYAVTSDDASSHAWHGYPREIIDSFGWVKLGGIKYRVPNPPETYLKCEYGNWKVKKRHWNCCVHPPCIASKVYVGGVFDLFHIGHLRLLKKAREYGEILYVSVLTDEAAERYKRKPIVPYEQRKEIVSNFADIILPQDDVDEVKCGLIDEINPSVIVHGNDKLPNSWNWAIIHRVKTVMVPYTKGVSTSQIIRRVKNANL